MKSSISKLIMRLIPTTKSKSSYLNDVVSSLELWKLEHAVKVSGAFSRYRCLQETKKEAKKEIKEGQR